MRLFRLLLPIAFAASLAAGCANPEEPDRPRDDAGVSRDAGPDRDGGTPRDAGATPDGGTVRDGGPPRDGGPGRIEVRRTQIAPAVGRAGRPGLEVRGRLGISGPQRSTSPGHEVRGGLVPSSPAGTP